MKGSKANARLARRRKAYDESPGIRQANTLAPGSFTRPGSSKKPSAGGRRG